MPGESFGCNTPSFMDQGDVQGNLVELNPRPATIANGRTILECLFAHLLVHVDCVLSLAEAGDAEQEQEQFKRQS